MGALIPAGELKRPDGRPNYAYIREVYQALMPEILASERWLDPYFVDWVRVFTPIEMAMWSLIRSQATPFYPQMPVGRFFVDFGNPQRRIAIECDGKQWHDAAIDHERDDEIMALGWSVFRFSGATCFKLPALPMPLMEWFAARHPVAFITLCTDDWLEEALEAERRSEVGEWQSEEALD